jgi:hypothetical protein
MIPIPFTELDIRIMTSEYRRGTTLPELGRRMGCDARTISRTLKLHGIQLRGRGERPSARLAQEQGT